MRSDAHLGLIGSAFQRHEAVIESECLVMPATSSLHTIIRKPNGPNAMVKILGECVLSGATASTRSCDTWNEDVSGRSFRHDQAS